MNGGPYQRFFSMKGEKGDLFEVVFQKSSQDFVFQFLRSFFNEWLIRDLTKGTFFRDIFKKIFPDFFLLKIFEYVFQKVFQTFFLKKNLGVQFWKRLPESFFQWKVNRGPYQNNFFNERRIGDHTKRNFQWKMILGTVPKKLFNKWLIGTLPKKLFNGQVNRGPYQRKFSMNGEIFDPYRRIFQWEVNWGLLQKETFNEKVNRGPLPENFSLKRWIGDLTKDLFNERWIWDLTKETFQWKV